MKYPMPKQLLSLLVVLTLAFTLVSTSVLAAPVTVTEENVVEKTGTGSIVVTVHNTDPGTAGSGAEISPGGDPVQGVGVNAAKVGTVAEVTTTENGSVSAQVLFGIDTSGTVNGTSILTLLGLDQDSAAARKGTVCYFSPEAVMAAVEKSSQTAIETALDGTEPGIAKAVTGADGVARFDSPSSGLYLLAKSQLPAEATTDLVPFLVSLPMYVGDNWETTVYAYPKVRTETLTLTKHAQVDNGDATYVNSGKTITYTLSTTIPATGSGQGSAQEFTDFSLTDTNTAKTLNLEESTVEVLLGGSLLTNGTDYTLSYGDSQEGTDSVLAVTLTEAGLKKLNGNLSQAQTFSITYQAVLATDVSFSSSLINRAVLSYDRGNGTASAEAQETLYTYGIDLTKTLSDQRGIAENSVSFGLFKDKSCSEQIPVGVLSSPSKAYWLAETVGSTEMYVGTDGHLRIYGVKPGTYYLKELATMNGYTPLTHPIKIEISAPGNPASQQPAAAVNGVPASVAQGVVSLSGEHQEYPWI